MQHQLQEFNAYNKSQWFNSEGCIDHRELQNVPLKYLELIFGQVHLYEWIDHPAKTIKKTSIKGLPSIAS